MLRYPDGIEGKSFYQKDAPDHTPEWVVTESIESDGEAIRYIICNDRDTLIWMVNLASIDLHPWLSTTREPRHAGLGGLRSRRQEGALRRRRQDRARGREGAPGHRPQALSQDVRRHRPPRVPSREARLQLRSDRHILRGGRDARGLRAQGHRDRRARSEPERLAGLRRFRAEPKGADGGSRLRRASPAGSSGLDTARLGRARDRPRPGAVQHPDHARAARRGSAICSRGLSGIRRTFVPPSTHFRRTTSAGSLDRGEASALSWTGSRSRHEEDVR